jgi:4-amino-4-deoxy-L-arabinose transferase-like glycosyltransferase
MSAPSPRFGRALAAIAAGGLALRLLYVLALAPNVRGSGDWQFFHALPNLMARGEGFIEPFVHAAFGHEVGTASHPPLWPLVLTPVSWLGGTGVQAHRAVGCVLGALVIVLVGLLARRLAGDRAGLAAALLAALHPTLVAADGSLMSETLYGLWIALALLLALRLLDRPGAGAAAALGAAIGLAALTRSEALALLVLPVAPLALLGHRRRWGMLGLAVLACALVIAPWSIRNLSAFDRPVLISHNDSTVLAGANCDATYRGNDTGSWRFDCISERDTFEEGEQAATWREEGLDYAGDHAGRLVAVIPVRALRTWSLWQPRRQVEFGEGRADWAESAGVVVYFLLLPLAATGAALLWRRSRARVLVLLSPALLVTLSSVIAYGVPRFRHAADLAIVVLAGSGLALLAERRASRSPRPAGA